MKTLSVKELVEFEEDIKQCYLQARIRAPIHLRSGMEQQLIEVFEQVEPDDTVFAYWASHLHCLLKGVPPQTVKGEILKGNSISLCFPEYNVYCSGIAGSLAGVAVGKALALKRRGVPAFRGGPRPKDAPHVWLFTGDMTAECGGFHEAVKYAHNFELPISFVVEDNGVSVLTDTRATWGSPKPWFEGTPYESRILHFRYENGFPHSGVNVRVAF